MNFGCFDNYYETQQRDYKLDNYSINKDLDKNDECSNPLENDKLILTLYGSI